VAGGVGDAYDDGLDPEGARLLEQGLTATTSACDGRP
jgi:hypothetical protein